jgi:hypothetical protein
VLSFQFPKSKGGGKAVFLCRLWEQGLSTGTSLLPDGSGWQGCPWGWEDPPWTEKGYSSTLR